MKVQLFGVKIALQASPVSDSMTTSVTVRMEQMNLVNLLSITLNVRLLEFAVRFTKQSIP